LRDSVVDEYPSMKRGSKQRIQQGDDRMGIILIVAGIIGLALLIYLFYVLFRGDEL
jgi:K+-transporting ATPase KdpF subunit